MKGTIKVPNIDHTLKYFVSEQDFDTTIGKGFWLFLEPFSSEVDKEGFFYFKREEDGFLIEGEGYICTSLEQVESHKRYVRRFKKIRFEPM